ncbi:MAG: CoA transferase [Chloroflexi bacterium]|nr:CoA transferase [Chloroflexota bacterium]
MTSNSKNNDRRALAGVKVLDLTHHVAGPYCTKLLADFGAEVTKVERPGVGDPARGMAPFPNDEPHPDTSLLFAYLNTSKRGITLDLKSPTGRGLLERLVADADMVVENFSPRVMPGFGLDYESLQRINPELIYVSISNFGQTGPYRDYKATDIVEYALGGLMYILGSHDREPLKHALRQTQFKAGTNAATAALIAYFHRLTTGDGQHVDVSIHEAVASALRDTASLFSYIGAIRQRQNTYSGDMPRSPMPAKDGYIVPIHFGGAVDWDDPSDFLGEPDLKREDFSTPERRLEHAKELHEALERGFGRWNKYDLFQEAHKRRGSIYGVVQSPAEVVDSEQYRHRGYFTEIDHPVIGPATYPGAPFRMSGTPWEASCPAPMLGQDNQRIYREKLGLSKDELMVLRASGVV